MLNKYGLYRPYIANDPPHVEMIKGPKGAIGDTDTSKLAQKTSADSKTNKTIITTIENNRTQNNVTQKAAA